MLFHSPAHFQTAWPTLRRPRLQLRRRPPQSNYPPSSVPDLDDRSRLERRSVKGGISPLAPPSPKAWVQSLPPILRIRRQHSLLRCSKGARGLFVLRRATGVFTGTTNSQHSTLRQRSNRYAIRAGRNLPDKEFRYLRTVIVTAAVYRGFNSRRRLAADLSF